MAMAGVMPTPPEMRTVGRTEAGDEGGGKDKPYVRVYNPVAISTKLQKWDYKISSLQKRGTKTGLFWGFFSRLFCLPGQSKKSLFFFPDKSEKSPKTGLYTLMIINPLVRDGDGGGDAEAAGDENGGANRSRG